MLKSDEEKHEKRSSVSRYSDNLSTRSITRYRKYIHEATTKTGINEKQYPILLTFRDNSLEKEFVEYYYGAKLTFIRISFVASLILLGVVFVYDFLTFSQNLTVPKRNSLVLRIVFQTSRGVSVLICAVITFLLQIPFFYKRKKIVEWSIILFDIVFLTTSIVQALIITDRSLYLTAVFCMGNLFRIRVWGFFFAMFVSFVTYVVCAIILKEDVLILVSTIATFVLFDFIELICMVMYETQFRKIFIATKKLTVVKKKAEDEHERQFELLKNIFPLPLVENVRARENLVIPLEGVTTALLDIVDFTQFCEHIRNKKLINILNLFYSKFDEIVSKNQIEKITTIGDGYFLISSVLDDKNKPSTRSVVACCCEMISAFGEISKMQKLEGLRGVRVGVGFGNVFMAIIGQSRLSFDIYGRAVDECRAMEQTGALNKVQVSERAHGEMASDDGLAFEKNPESGGYILVESIEALEEVAVIPSEKTDEKAAEPVDGKKNNVVDTSTSVHPVVVKETKAKKILFKVLDLLLIFPSWKMNWEFLKSTYETTSVFSNVVIVCFILLEIMAVTNTLIFGSYHPVYWIFIGIAIVSILVWIIGAVCGFFLRKNPSALFISASIFIFISIVLATFFVYGTFLTVFLKHGAEMENFRYFMIFDLIGQLFPFLMYLFPSVHLIVKFLIIFLTNLPFNVLVLLLTALPNNLFNFVYNLVCSTVGFYAFHYGTMLFFKREDSLNNALHGLELEIEKNRTILSSILPDYVLKKLLGGENAGFHFVENGSILFAIVDHAYANSENDVVTEYNKIYTAFDEIVNAIDGCVKIKNTGNSYLVISGLNEEYDHRVAILTLAKKLNEFSENFESGCEMKFTFGIHSGSFSCGIVGRTKFLFDCFGDSLNVCYRIAENCGSGKILASDAFLEGLNVDQYEMSESRTLELKGGRQVPVKTVL